MTFYRCPTCGVRGTGPSNMLDHLAGQHHVLTYNRLVSDATPARMREFRHLSRRCVRVVRYIQVNGRSKPNGFGLPVSDVAGRVGASEEDILEMARYSSRQDGLYFVLHEVAGVQRLVCTRALRTDGPPTDSESEEVGLPQEVPPSHSPGGPVPQCSLTNVFKYDFPDWHVLARPSQVRLAMLWLKNNGMPFHNEAVCVLLGSLMSSGAVDMPFDCFPTAVVHGSPYTPDPARDAEEVLVWYARVNCMQWA